MHIEERKNVIQLQVYDHVLYRYVLYWSHSNKRDKHSMLLEVFDCLEINCHF